MKNNISRYRAQVCISQSGLAAQLGWGASRIGNYEAGLRDPGLGECRQIVAALNLLGAVCTIDDIFPETAMEELNHENQSSD